MLMLRVVLMLSLAVINSYPAAEVPPPPPMEEGDETPPPPPAPEKETEIIPGPPAVEEDGQEAPPPPPLAETEELAPPPPPLKKISFKEVAKLNPEDPWIKSLLSYHQQSIIELMHPIENASISSDGNVVMIASNKKVDLLNKYRGIWQNITSDLRQDLRLSNITMSASADRFVIRDERTLKTYTYNPHVKSWQLSPDIPTQSAAQRLINGDGDRLVVSEKDLSLSIYDYENNAWMRTFSLNLNANNLFEDRNSRLMQGEFSDLKAISWDGTCIAHSLLMKNRITTQLKVITLQDDSSDYQIQDIDTNRNDIYSVSISGNNKYIAMELGNKDERDLYLYKKQGNSWQLLQKFKGNAIACNYNASLVVIIDTSTTAMQFNVYKKITENKQERWEEKNSFTIPTKSKNRISGILFAGNNLLVYAGNTAYALRLITLEEIKRLQFDTTQLNFIRDLYQSKQKLPKKPVVLNPQQEKLLGTFPADIQMILRGLYLQSSQESPVREEKIRAQPIPAQQPSQHKKVIKKKKAAQSVTTSTAAHK